METAIPQSLRQLSSLPRLVVDVRQGQGPSGLDGPPFAAVLALVEVHRGDGKDMPGFVYRRQDKASGPTESLAVVTPDLLNTLVVLKRRKPANEASDTDVLASTPADDSSTPSSGLEASKSDGVFYRLEVSFKAAQTAAGNGAAHDSAENNYRAAFDFRGDPGATTAAATTICDIFQSYWAGKYIPASRTSEPRQAEVTGGEGQDVGVDGQGRDPDFADLAKAVLKLIWTLGHDAESRGGLSRREFKRYILGRQVETMEAERARLEQQIADKQEAAGGAAGAEQGKPGALDTAGALTERMGKLLAAEPDYKAFPPSAGRLGAQSRNATSETSSARHDHPAAAALRTTGGTPRHSTGGGSWTRRGQEARWDGGGSLGGAGGHGGHAGYTGHTGQVGHYQQSVSEGSHRSWGGGGGAAAMNMTGSPMSQHHYQQASMGSGAGLMYAAGTGQAHVMPGGKMHYGRISGEVGGTYSPDQPAHAGMVYAGGAGYMMPGGHLGGRPQQQGGGVGGMSMATHTTYATVPSSVSSSSDHGRSPSVIMYSAPPEPSTSSGMDGRQGGTAGVAPAPGFSAVPVIMQDGSMGYALMPQAGVMVQRAS